jgi:hypothetical protein
MRTQVILHACRTVFAMLMGAGSICSAAPLVGPEYVLKAAFIYNFAMFTTWAERFDQTITLCVLGRDPFGAALDPLAGKQIGSAKLAIRRIKTRAEMQGACQIVFVTESEVDDYLDQFERAQDGGAVLTIADKEGAAQRGMMIELTVEDKKIGFEFNWQAARLGNVEVSSKLLRMARKVH